MLFFGFSCLLVFVLYMTQFTTNLSGPQCDIAIPTTPPISDSQAPDTTNTPNQSNSQSLSFLNLTVSVCILFVDLWIDNNE
jgi:hypothetical protein